jgi:hypothetical protein
VVGVVAVIAVVSAVAACADSAGDDDALLEPSQEAEEAEGGVHPAAFAYMAAFGTRDARAMEQMRPFASPGSPADLYATYQIQRARAFPEEPPEDVEARRDGTVQACISPPNGAQDCAVYADFRLDADERLESFTIDGLTIDGRLVGQGDTVVADGVQATLASAYRSGEGSVWAFVDLVNDRETGIVVAGDASAYVMPDGARTPPHEGVRPGPTIPPGETGTVVLRFDDSALGGSLDLRVLTDDPNSEVVVPVPIG